jgi:hypothetical protein
METEEIVKQIWLNRNPLHKKFYNYYKGYQIKQIDNSFYYIKDNKILFEIVHTQKHIWITSDLFYLFYDFPRSNYQTEIKLGRLFRKAFNLNSCYRIHRITIFTAQKWGDIEKTL